MAIPPADDLATRRRLIALLLLRGELPAREDRDDPPAPVTPPSSGKDPA